MGGALWDKLPVLLVNYLFLNGRCQGNLRFVGALGSEMELTCLVLHVTSELPLWKIVSST